MKQSKRWIALALSAVLGFSGLGASSTNWATADPQTPPPVKAMNFTDVPSSHYAFEAIKTMNGLGIITGYPDGRFKPEAEVRRVEFATMMVKALKLKVVKTNKSSFEDMQQEAWAIPYVEAAKPYLTGYKSSVGLTFKPREASVREDMAVALVKALHYPVTSGQSIEVYADKALISEELKPYVAAAIEKGLMIGETKDGNRYFNPQKTLSRAEAAQLLMNVIKEEKITFDDVKEDEKKVVLDENDNNDLKRPVTVKGTVLKDGNILLSWTPINEQGFEGYKVVASIKDKTPAYPENGYQIYITDKQRTSYTIKPGMGYNSGDFEKFKAGQSYYFSITAVYSDKKVPGNVIRLTLPETDNEEERSSETDTLKVKAVPVEGGYKLEWTEASKSGFQGYKVVASLSDESPKYPENGYKHYITDIDENKAYIRVGDSYNNGDVTVFKAGKTYYVSITYLYEDGKRYSNVIRISL